MSELVQVLVAAMNQNDYMLPEKMNLNSDAIVGNQCNHNSIEEVDYKGHVIKYLNFAEKGVGLNRNNALMRADADICLFADDDMVYKDDYVKIVQESFRKIPQADVLVFNLQEENSERYVIKKYGRVWYHNYLRYGTARVAVRLKSIKENGIYFNQCFGGGTEHCHGEDNIFLTDCLKKGLKIYAVPKTIALLTNERESTWNSGYDEKYIRDQGELYRKISRRFWILLCLRDALLRCKKDYNMSFRKAFFLLLNKS